MLRIISLGAGVQSTTMALMAAVGEIKPMPDCAIFADTQDESAATYAHLAWLESILPFPVYRASRGHLSKALLNGDDAARIPAFLRGGGLMKRQCTRNFKIRIIGRKTREILGVGSRGYIPPKTVERWIGISIDEADRMKPPVRRYESHRWPLIEAEMTRQQCDDWLHAHFKRRAPKSSCKCCPFQSDAQWRALKERSPDEFAQACWIDAQLRSHKNKARFRGEPYLHRSRIPLAEIDFSSGTPHDQFSNECDGVCGV